MLPPTLFSELKRRNVYKAQRMKFFAELKRRNVSKVPIVLAKVIDLAKWLPLQTGSSNMFCSYLRSWQKNRLEKVSLCP
jgi:hypothetical protein